MMKKETELATMTKREKEEEHIIGIVKVCRTDLRPDQKKEIPI